MKISIIAAVSQNGVIGKNGKIPWKLPPDIKRFRKLTMGHTIIMGRKTFESIGHPLKKRKNIVLSQNRKLKIRGCLVFDSLTKAFDFAFFKKEKEVFVIGGENVYKDALPFAKKIYLTLIKKDYKGDTFFPSLDEKEWKKTYSKSYNYKNIPFEFQVFERK